MKKTTKISKYQENRPSATGMKPEILDNILTQRFRKTRTKINIFKKFSGKKIPNVLFFDTTPEFNPDINPLDTNPFSLDFIPLLCNLLRKF